LISVIVFADERLTTENDDNVIYEQNAADCVQLILMKKSNNILTY